MAASAKPVIFISYAHADEPEKPAEGETRWLSFVLRYLQPAVKGGIFELWVDRQMTGGADWEPEIETKLRACDIFILLVSAHSMASNYIIDKEIAIIRERQARHEPIHFYPLLLTPTPKAGLQKVNDKNLRPRDAKPFSSYSAGNDRLQHMSDAADEIAELAERIVRQKTAAQPHVPPQRQPAYVHITGLPETAYERLVGRDAELKCLDDAWADPTVNIVSLVAEGGAGKSALVNEWLRRMQADSYRGAEAVLGWSFYSQGSKERATSAEPFLNWALDRLGIKIETTGATAKGEAIAEALASRRVLLVLDGAEPLQHGLGSQQGELKEPGLRALLRRFAAMPPAEQQGLVVLTSRLAVKDIARWKAGAAPVLDVEELTEEAGAALLRDNGVWGTDKELRAAARAFGGHALALGLLASFLTETQFGDVRRRDHIRALLADADNPGHDHARRVMESYEREWFSQERAQSQRQTIFEPDPELPAESPREAPAESLPVFGEGDRRVAPVGWGSASRRPQPDPTRPAAKAAGHPPRRRGGILALLIQRPRHSEKDVMYAIMRMVGLFDRPASGDCLRALRQKPAIPGLTEAVVDLDETAWRHAVARLREVRLLAPPDPSAPEALDAHPLVREWFGQRLERTNPDTWRAAHGRLFEYLRDTTREGTTPTLESLTPLFQAIAHGCRAGRRQETLDKVYRDRICRRKADGSLEFYSFHKLGAIGTGLAAISWFFEKPYETPHATLTAAAQAWVRSEAALALNAQGRLNEALPAMRAGLTMRKESQLWNNAAIGACNLSQLELLAGEVAPGVATAEQGVAYADRSGDEFWMVASRAAHADALHTAGQREESENLFAGAELRQAKWQPIFPLLYSLQGFHYCDLLLAKGECPIARDRASRSLAWVRAQNWLLNIALDTLTLGRAHLGLALDHAALTRPAAAARDDARTAEAQLRESVDLLRAAGSLDHVPRGHLARAAFRRSVGDWAGAARDLDEVEEIAEPGPMRLYLCDMALERARLALARIEAFAPLHGLIDDSPRQPEPPDAAMAARLAAEAAANLATARKLIADCGYHRRDEELAELETVANGKRRFADLPPRV